MSAPRNHFVDKCSRPKGITFGRGLVRPDKSRRERVIELYKQGTSPEAISERLGYRVVSVKRIIRVYKNSLTTGESQGIVE